MHGDAEGWCGVGSLVGLVVVSVIFFALGVFWQEHREHEDARYLSPLLHEEGRWEGPRLRGSTRHARAVWENLDAPAECSHPNTRHVISVCTVGPGTAHEDLCVCGAKRYGVYGAWS